MEKNWFSKSVDEVKKELLTDLEKGLTDEQISKQREKFGKNELKSTKKEKFICKIFRAI